VVAVLGLCVCTSNSLKGQAARQASSRTPLQSGGEKEEAGESLQTNVFQPPCSLPPSIPRGPPPAPLAPYHPPLNVDTIAFLLRSSVEGQRLISLLLLFKRFAENVACARAPDSPSAQQPRSSNALSAIPAPPPQWDCSASKCFTACPVRHRNRIAFLPQFP